MHCHQRAGNEYGCNGSNSRIGVSSSVHGTRFGVPGIGVSFPDCGGASGKC